MTTKPTIVPRTSVVATAYDHHGALDYAELAAWGFTPDDIIDFSVNSNPFGPAPGVYDALQTLDIARYPDREALVLRQALATQFDLGLEQLVVGNGVAELLWLVALAYIQPGDHVLILGPTFGEYARSVALFDGQSTVLQAQPRQQFVHEPAAVQAALARLQPRLAFICNPNNPTGVLIPPAEICAWADAHPQCLFVIDEAYIQFVPSAVSMLHCKLANVLVLRSMTKDYALAGLRLGYAVGPEAIIAALAQARAPWNVNAAAQVAGLAALQDTAHLQNTCAQLLHAKRTFFAGLTAQGWIPVPSVTHYFLLPVEDGAAFRHRLLAQRIQVRDCASFGLPAYVRIASRQSDDNARLLAVLQTW